MQAIYNVKFTRDYAEDIQVIANKAPETADFADQLVKELTLGDKISKVDVIAVEDGIGDGSYTILGNVHLNAEQSEPVWIMREGVVALQECYDLDGAAGDFEIKSLNLDGHTFKASEIATQHADQIIARDLDVIKTPELQAWVSSIRDAYKSNSFAQYGFTSSLSSDDSNKKWTEKNGMSASIVGFFVDAETKNGFDPEALPYLLARFDDGTVLQVEVDEMIPLDGGQELLDAVSRGFSLARDMGYIDPADLAKNGTGADKELFTQMVLQNNVFSLTY